MESKVQKVQIERHLKWESKRFVLLPPKTLRAREASVFAELRAE